jgi:hypothetical protein
MGKQIYIELNDSKHSYNLICYYFLYEWNFVLFLSFPCIWAMPYFIIAVFVKINFPWLLYSASYFLLRTSKSPEFGTILTSRTADRGTRYRSWLRHYATSRKVAGSIPDEVIRFFKWQSFQLHYGPGVYSASKRNECQESSWRLRAASA